MDVFGTILEAKMLLLTLFLVKLWSSTVSRVQLLEEPRIIS